MRSAFANQEQNSMLHVRAISPRDGIQTLLEILWAPRSNVSTAESKQEPAQHGEILLLVIYKVWELGLMWVVNHNLDDPTGTDTDASGTHR